MKRVVVTLALAALTTAASALGAQAATSTSIEPQRSRLGDLVVATLVTDEPLRVQPSFGPFVVRATRVDSVGGRTRQEFTLQCLDPACVPDAGPRHVALPAAVVDGTRVAWPDIVVVPRATAPAVARPGSSFRRETASPPARYAVDPDVVRWLLLAAAIAVAAAGVALLGFRRAADDAGLTPLQRALRLLRDSARRAPADRRRALDLLARSAEVEGITAVAWSAVAPTPERVLTIADEVEGRA